MTYAPDDAHAVVTGGGTGIGLAIARTLSEAGMRVTILGRDRRRLEQAAAALGDRAAWFACDVTDDAAVEATFAAAAIRGPVHVLVNNAGAVETASLAATTPALWQRMLAVNVTGAFLCQQQVLPAMRAAGAGRIVNIASTAGLTGYAYVSAYVAAKHALVGLTRATARELAATSITVNAVCPGYTDTDIVTRAVETISAKTGRTPDQARAALVSHNPQGRLIAPEEVAAAVRYLVGPEAAAVTGQALVLAGGELM